MQIQPLEAAQLAELRQRFAHRFPQPATLHITGDRGVGNIDVPILLGLPTGACPAAPGVPVSGAWSEYVGASILRRPDPAGWREEFVSDVVLFPDNAGLQELLEHWPALTATIAQLALKKCGGPDSVTQPLATEKAPEPIARALAERPRASWRWVRPTRAAAFAVVVDCPPPALWSMFAEGIREDGAKHWQLVRDFLDGCNLVAFDGAGQPVTLERIIGQWPGVAIGLVAPIAALGGAAASGELGE